MPITDINLITKQIMEKELNKVLDFIEGWQTRNPYNPSILGAYNCKFKADLKAFFEASDFNTITINEIIN